MKKKTVLAAVLALLVVSILSAAGAPEVPQIISSSFGKPSSSSSSSSRNGTKSDQIDEDMERIEYLYRYIDTYFYQDVDYQKAYEAMATALFSGRNYTLPDDVQKLAVHVLAHRLVLDRRSGIRGESRSSILTSIIREIKVPAVS